MSLALAAATGFAAAGLALVIRAVVPTLWLLVKPFSCDLCMSWWGSVAFTGLRVVGQGVSTIDALPDLFGSVATSVVVLKVVGKLSDVGASPVGDWTPTLPETHVSGDTFPAKE